MPSLIGSTNGQAEAGARLKKSECSRCHAPFVAGQTCIEIPKLGGAYSTSKRVCDECFQAILTKTCEDFEAVKAI